MPYLVSIPLIGISVHTSCSVPRRYNNRTMVPRLDIHRRRWWSQLCKSTVSPYPILIPHLLCLNHVSRLINMHFSWARGNSWITIAIPIFLDLMKDHLPKTSPDYKFLVSTWKRQVDRLITLQDDKTGLWHTLLVDPTSYVESSASAGFVAGIFMGLRMVCPYLSTSSLSEGVGNQN
jgi:hypothetical protein